MNVIQKESFQNHVICLDINNFYLPFYNKFIYLIYFIYTKYNLYNMFTYSSFNLVWFLYFNIWFTLI